MFLSSKTLCAYTTLSNFCKVTASLLKELSFIDKEMFSFGAMNSSKWLQWFHGFGWVLLVDKIWETSDGFWGQMTNFGTQFQPKNSHWFSIFSRSPVFVYGYLLFSFEDHQSSSTDVHCIGGFMEQYPLEDHHKLKMNS